MKFKTKKELIQELINGKKFITPEGNTLLYDEEYVCDFGIKVNHNYHPVNLDHLIKEELIGAEYWYEDIPEEGVFCWASDLSEDLRKFAVTIIAYNPEEIMRFMSTQCGWLYATPVTMDDLKEILYECT